MREDIVAATMCTDDDVECMCSCHDLPDDGDIDCDIPDADEGWRR